ncbi:MAG: TAXI family TRAP transporter solute-binding subunit [Lachnospiraceae bacterium]|nr:TAXI family TRAP transporter solute-binding subunit [Lachnospiraceae bacterium]
MKKYFTKGLAVVTAVTMMLSLAACSSGNSSNSTGDSAPTENEASSDTPVYMTFGASPSSSQFYTYWTAVGQTLMSVYPNYKVDVSETQGAVDSTNRVVAGDLEMGISTSATDYENFNGTGTWEGEPHDQSRLLWYFDESPIQIVVGKDSGISSFSDLSGKRFGPGGTGTSCATIVKTMLEVLDVDAELFEAGQGDIKDAVIDRQIVGGAKAGIAGDSFVMEIGASIPIDIISFTDEEIEKICAEIPYVVPATIPAGTYEGIDYDVNTIQILQGSQATKDLSQEMGYKFVKAMFEDGFDVWSVAYPQGAEKDLAKLTLQSPIPLHAGTVQYFVEKGYDVPEELIPDEYVAVN